MDLEGVKRWVQESEVLLEMGNEKEILDKDQKGLVILAEILLE